MSKKEGKKDEEEIEETTESPKTKVEQILKLYQENPSMSYKEIAKKVKTTEGYVANVIFRHYKNMKGNVPTELEPLDELEYLRRIIMATWGNQQKADLIISLFKDHDPNNLKILYSLLNKAQCPKTAQELIIYSWAKHRHIPADEIKEMFKNNKSILRTFRELGYFEEEDFEEDEDEDVSNKSSKKEDDNLEDLLEELKKEKLKALKKRLEELRLKKELQELERQLNEYEEKEREEEFDFGDHEELWRQPPPAPQPVTRKVVRPAINPVTGEVLRDENGNIIFETVEEPVDGSAQVNPMDDMMRWMLALQQQNKKEDPEKELLRKELEELKRKMEEEEKRRREEEERRKYDERINALQEEMQEFRKQIVQMIEALKNEKTKSNQQSFERELLLKLLEDKNKIPPEVERIIEEEREIIKKLQEQPKTDEEKKLLLKKIDELEKKLEKREIEEMFGKYNQYINALYQQINELRKDISKKNMMSDEKYKIDKIIEMDKGRLEMTEKMVERTTESILGPAIKIALENVRQQDMWNKYMMLLQEEQRRNLPPGTLIDKFFGAPRVTEDEKRELLSKIDEEMKDEE